MELIKNNRPIVNELNTAFRQMEKQGIIHSVRMNSKTRNVIASNTRMITSLQEGESLWTADIIIDESLHDNEFILANKDYTFSRKFNLS